MDTSQSASSDKKSAFDGLDREELIRKCKGLLNIAQKAKKAKDDLANEVTALKEKLTECDTQKQADKDCLKTMQLMIDSLTETKLAAANKIADLEKSNKNLTQQISNCNEKLAKLAEFEIENEAQKKQINRLTEENEEQEMDLRKLDERFAKVSELSKRQTQELLVLEQSVDRWKAMEVAYQHLEQENKELQAKKTETTTETETRVETEVVEQDDDADEKIDVVKEQLQHENEQLKKECDEQKSKLKKYKLKVIEFSNKLKEVKESKKILQSTVVEYSRSVSKWHVQISHASKLLVKEVNELNSAKADLENRLESKQSMVEDLEKTIVNLEARLRDISMNNGAGVDEAKEKYEKLLEDYKTLEQDIEAKNTEMESLTHEWEASFTALKDENEKRRFEIGNLVKDLEAKSQLVTELEEKEKSFSKKSEELSSEKCVLAKMVEDLQSRLKENSSNRDADDVKEKYEKLLAEYQTIQQELQAKNTETESLTNEWEASFTALKDENEKRRSEVENLLKELEAKSQMVAELEEKEQSLSNKNGDLLAEKSDLEKMVENAQARLEEISTNNAADVSDVKEKYEKLLYEYRTLEQELQAKNTEIETLATEWEASSTALKDENEKRRSEIENLVKELEGRSQMVTELEEKENSAGKKNEELLAEMRELNEILKTRGNLISKQTAEMDQLKSKLTEQSNQISQLEENLKEKHNNQFETQSDILSTSTISRADEIARMRDVEDSFEEKYNKLRGLAVKLKKKVAEQQATITKLESTSQPDQSSSTNAQNLKSLQTENDRLQDKIDNMTIERKKYKTEIEELNRIKQKHEEELKSLQIVNEDIKAASDANRKIKSALDEKIKADGKQIEALKNDNRNVTQQLKDTENEIIKIKDQVKQKEAEVTAKVEEMSKLKTELNKLKSSMKKSNVLSLEVEAYEKSLKDMAEKLEAHVKQLAEVRNEKEQHEATIQALKADILKLNNELELEKQNSNDLQQHNDLQKIKLKENNSEITELKRIIDDHVKESNTIKIELANLQSQQSENEVEKQKFVSKLKNENEKNVAQIFGLEEEVRDLKSKLSTCEQELANIQSDFASYKVRAQTVLRQNQAKDSSSEEELKEELALLQQTKDDLTSKLEHSSEQQRHLQHTIDELKGEKQNLQERYKKLLQLIEETRQQMESIQNENRKQTQEHQESLKMHRLQIDTLNNCFKKQIDEMQQKYEKEISNLKTVKPSADGEDVARGPVKSSPLSDEQRIEMIMMERQAGEGSENTSSLQMRKVSNASRSKHELIPLDELLNNSFEEEEIDATDMEIEDTVSKEKFAVQQSRVKHLSALLSEAEMDVTRLTEMNNMLKEELRRQERSTEREKHMHNLEYMKNVIFKFLTINNADERAHLVPVLNIILKLSPDESKQLQNVARGSDGGQSSWSNLLPAW